MRMERTEVKLLSERERPRVLLKLELKVQSQDQDQKDQSQDQRENNPLKDITTTITRRLRRLRSIAKLRMKVVQMTTQRKFLRLLRRKRNNTR